MVAPRAAKPGSSWVPAGAPSAASRSRASVTIERPSGVSSRIEATSAAVRAAVSDTPGAAVIEAAIRFP